MAHILIFASILIYIALFYITGSFSGLLTFPPPPFTFEFLGFSELGLGRAIYVVPWTGMLLFIGVVCITMVILLNLVNLEVLGTGLKLDAKHISTLVIGMIMTGFIGYTLAGAFPVTTPFMVTILMVWIPIILLGYSMIYQAGAGS